MKFLREYGNLWQQFISHVCFALHGSGTFDGQMLLFSGALENYWFGHCYDLVA